MAEVTTHSQEQEEVLFDAARKLGSEAARKAFLDQACQGDGALRERIELLLSAQVDADAFFKTAAPLAAGASPVASGDMPPAGLDAPLSEGPGARIGRYKLLQKIGEGGCGVVYMAEQEIPVRRRVALKIIKLGMDTKNVIARFEAERQALALMDHPNIARVLDAGATETGRPFFVMELVRGLKITEYCNQANQDTDQRLKLFIQICQAIQHAHQKGIIHRDIKPSNILVTLHDGVPVPKVIDFGIAKATEMRLTDKTLFTAYEQFIGTPAYMSPEQAEMSGLDIDTRTDIYSLGVLLYELLTGKTPFDPAKLMQSGLDEMRRTLREREPQRPSTMVTTMQGQELLLTAKQRQAEPPRLISLLKGDLDWIVMKALEKDRSRRYETANGLAMDIQRHLDNEPVIARPPSRFYQFQKLVRRNRVLFAAGSAVVLALMIGMGTSTWLLIRERAAHQRALQAEQQEKELRRQAETRERITQAAVLVNAGQFEEADELMKQVPILRPTVEGARVLRSLGEWHVLYGNWKQAAERFSALLLIDELDGPDVETLDALECGAALVEAGDLAGYERFRESAVARLNSAAYPFADRVIKICLLIPADEPMLNALEPVAQSAIKSLPPVTATPNDDIFQAAWMSVSLALMEFREGNFSNAMTLCRRCLSYPERNAPREATARIILAMSLQKLGRRDEASAEFKLGRDAVEARFRDGLERGTGVQGFWFDWLFARILMREAEALIQP